MIYVWDKGSRFNTMGQIPLEIKESSAYKGSELYELNSGYWSECQKLLKLIFSQPKTTHVWEKRDGQWHFLEARDF